MVDEFAARHDAAGVMHEIGEQPVFVAGQLHRLAIDGDAPDARVEPDGPATSSLEAWPAARRSSARNRASTSSMWNGFVT